eukprot:1188430-Prorocentrum_minimum.AAC.1
MMPCFISVGDYDNILSIIGMDGTSECAEFHIPLADLFKNHGFFGNDEVHFITDDGVDVRLAEARKRAAIAAEKNEEIDWSEVAEKGTPAGVVYRAQGSELVFAPKLRVGMPRGVPVKTTAMSTVFQGKPYSRAHPKGGVWLPGCYDHKGDTADPTKRDTADPNKGDTEDPNWLLPGRLYPFKRT